MKTFRFFNWIVGSWINRYVTKHVYNSVKMFSSFVLVKVYLMLAERYDVVFHASRLVGQSIPSVHNLRLLFLQNVTDRCDR